ncbi:MAG TPA: DUF4249 domain-containing protein [Bacteroidia bacterium]|jgi:hypothetical protein|nr:DUF4249 domain-containing protein [Bacteroidia bacterium]
MKRISAIFLIAIISLTGCVKSFVPDIDKYDNLLVIDGGVTDGPGPYVIRLSKSGAVKERSKLQPYPNCKVQIKDNVGNTYDLTETQAGVYQSDSAIFRGIPGRGYQLFISTADGEHVESTMDELKAALKIESIEARVEHLNDPSLFFGRDGYQFYVNTAEMDSKDNYLLWRLQCTYKFRTDFAIASYINKNGVYVIPDNGDTLRNCFRTVDILKILLLNTTDLNTTAIKHHALYFEDNYSKALTIRYSLKVIQYKMNEATFKYWSELQKFTDSGGDLYSAQPYQVTNNLKNITLPDRPVLGYFMVAGVSEKRIFLNKPPIVFRYDECSVGPPQQFIVEKMLRRADLWPLYFASTPGLYLLDQECVNCEKLGTMVKPSFWEE